MPQVGHKWVLNGRRKDLSSPQDPVGGVSETRKSTDELKNSKAIWRGKCIRGFGSLLGG